MIALDRTRLTGRLFIYALTRGIYEVRGGANLVRLAGAKTRREDMKI
jgi:hypothetical protein